jgi:hypothetical protein
LRDVRSLVSELNQYGGTPDCIALINSKVSLVEFKTSAKPFADHLVAMAAHAALWNENNPGRPIEAFHWIRLPKDGGEFRHHAYVDLSIQWQIFLCYLDCWRLEKGLIRKRTKVTAEAPKPAPSAEVAPTPRRSPRKPVVEQPAKTTQPIMPPQSMAELLRAYGHLRDHQLV